MLPPSVTGNGELTFSSDGTRAEARFKVDFLPPPEAPKKGQLGWYLTNVILLVLIGLGLSVWLWVYTPYFSAFGTALGLGGVFVWMAFLRSLIREERKKSMVEWIDRKVLSNRWGTLVAGLFFLTVVGVILTHGTIVLIYREEGKTRTVSVKEQAAGGKRYILVEDVITSQSTLPLLVGPLFLQRTVLVRVSGLPPLERNVEPLDRIRLEVPGSFALQPVALIRLEPNWTASGAQSVNKLSMEVTIHRPGAQDLVALVPNYRGQTVWVGCDATVPIPETVSSKWEKTDQSILSDWLNPTFVHANVALRPEDDIEVTLRKNGALMTSQKHSMPPAERLPGGVKEIYLQSS